MKSRIFIISELYYPEETSTGFFLTRIAEGLAESYEVNVLCSQPTYSSRGRRAIINEFHDGVNIHRCWSTTFSKDVLPLRLINILTITVSFLINCLIRFKRNDCIFVVTNPPILPFVVLVASILRKAKCCLIIHDVYPETIVSSGLATKNSVIVKAINCLTQLLYRQMSCIIVLGRDMKTLIKRKLGSVKRPVYVIPNWGDTDIIKPSNSSVNPLLNRLGLSEKFVIQYSGNIGRTHGIEYLVTCAEQLITKRSIHFLFIGFGGKKLWLMKYIKEKGLQNITLMDYLPRSELPISLNACDISIISFLSGMAGVSVPSRMYNVMSAGKPILAVADIESELARVVTEEGIGWVVAPGDTDGLIKAILEARSDPERLSYMGRKARLVAENKYSFERVKKDYSEMVHLLTK